VKHGWTREAKGLPTLAEQRAALEAAGVAPERIRVDRKQKATEPSTFDLMLRAVRQHDMVVIASAGCLAPTRADALLRVAAVGTQCGTVWDCSIAEEIKGEAVLRQFVDRADRELARSRTATARRILAGANGGPKLTEAKRRAIMPDWHNPELTAAQIAQKHGVSRRLLFAKMGPRFPRESADAGPAGS
jgi:hypothetical protein